MPTFLRTPDLARNARRQTATTCKAAVKSVLTKAGDLLFRANRNERELQALVEKLQTMPAYLLDDIGVTRSEEGQFLYETDFGVLADLLAATETAPRTAKPLRQGAHPAFAAI